MRGRLLALPHFRQETPHSCVAACARMALAFFGTVLQEEDLSQLLDTDETGTRFRDLANLAAFGLDVRLDSGDLAELGNQIDQGRHCIVRVKTLASTPRFSRHNRLTARPGALIARA